MYTQKTSNDVRKVILGFMACAVATGAAISLSCGCSYMFRSHYRKQNSPDFNQKLADTHATLVSKRRYESPTLSKGIMYFDTNQDPSTIEARMDIPLQSEDRDMIFEQIPVGATNSLLNFKRQFEPEPSAFPISPGRGEYVELFLKSDYQK